MANNKAGLRYYTLDTDRYQDRRIKRLKKDMGCRGIAVYDRILCEVYRVRGYYLEWDSDTAFDIAEYFGLKEETVNEIVRYCCACGLFDSEKLSQGIITSASIQQRYSEMCFRAKRRIADIAEPYRCDAPAIGMDAEPENFPDESMLPDDDEPETLTLDEEVALMQSDEKWMGQVQELHKFSRSELLAKLAQFKAECVGNGTDGHVSVQDAKKHFNSWLRKMNRTKDKNDNATTGTKRRGKRGGVLLKGDESKTYGDAF